MKNNKVIFLFIIVIFFIGCLNKDTGDIKFTANGEDFVRKGFVSKDGWRIDFFHIYLTLNNIVSYQKVRTGKNEKIKYKAVLPGIYTIDLAKGDENAATIVIDELDNRKTGYYNSIDWQLVQNKKGEYNGYSIVLIGTALKNDKKINFKIKIDEEFKYTCGEYIGDERKGFLKKNGYTEQEITFHFDHIFGDGSVDINDELNKEAPGFDIFYNYEKNGEINIDLKQMKADLTEYEYKKLQNALITLGHVGEGHCDSEIIEE